MWLVLPARRRDELVTVVLWFEVSSTSSTASPLHKEEEEMSTDLDFSLQIWDHSIIALAFCLQVKGAGWRRWGREKYDSAEDVRRVCAGRWGVGGNTPPQRMNIKMHMLSSLILFSFCHRLSLHWLWCYDAVQYDRSLLILRKEIWLSAFDR